MDNLPSGQWQSWYRACYGGCSASSKICSLSLPHLRSLTHTQITEVPKVRYVDKIVEMKVKVPRNVYKDKIIEVEKTVYVDVPVRMDNIITNVVETFTEVPVEIVRVEAV